MADTSAKFAKILDMVEEGLYFAINRPRQYGKTTTLFQLVRTLNQNEEYVAFCISFEGIGDEAFEEERVFCPTFLSLLKGEAKLRKQPLLQALLGELEQTVVSFLDLSEAITRLVEDSDKKVVLLIDEVDKSSNNQLFLSFLGILRDKYLKREDIPTFHSVVLVGVHDVKSLKLKLRIWCLQDDRISEIHNIGSQQVVKN